MGRCTVFLEFFPNLHRELHPSLLSRYSLICAPLKFAPVPLALHAGLISRVTILLVIFLQLLFQFCKLGLVEEQIACRELVEASVDGGCFVGIAGDFRGDEREAAGGSYIAGTELDVGVWHYWGFILEVGCIYLLRLERNCDLKCEIKDEAELCPAMCLGLVAHVMPRRLSVEAALPPLISAT